MKSLSQSLNESFSNKKIKGKWISFKDLDIDNLSELNKAIKLLPTDMAWNQKSRNGKQGFEFDSNKDAIRAFDAIVGDAQDTYDTNEASDNQINESSKEDFIKDYNKNQNIFKSTTSANHGDRIAFFFDNIDKRVDAKKTLKSWYGFSDNEIDELIDLKRPQSMKYILKVKIK